MNRITFLEKLRRNEPIFTCHPKVEWSRIRGNEIEFAVDQKFIARTESENYRIDRFVPNGGRLYTDCKHLEIATPESSNAASALAMLEGSKRYTWREGLSTVLFANNRDRFNSTFGFHENYCTKSNPVDWPELIPYLIARIVISGSGYMDGIFQISQRADFIVEAMGDDSTQKRPILHRRLIEPLVDVQELSRWKRIHLLCGDAKMCQFANFIDNGMTSLVIELLEHGKLPNIPYDLSLAVKDFKRVSNHQKDWYLAGIMSGPKGVLEILTVYLDAVKRQFLGRDEVNDAVIYGMEHALEELGKDPMRLIGYLDWPTKLDILNKAREQDVWTNSWLHDLDLDFHSLNPEKSLFSFLENSGAIKKIVSDEFIESCVLSPPPDTRAFARGEVVKMLKGKDSPYTVIPNRWTEIDLQLTQNIGHVVLNILPQSISIPWENYAHVPAELEPYV